MTTTDDPAARLDALVGVWTGEETLQGGVTGRTTSVAHRRLGTFVIADHYQVRSDGRVYDNHLVYGWDARRGRYSVVQYDSAGRGGDAMYGDWSGDTLTFEAATPGGHFRYAYAFAGETYAFTFARSKDGTSWETVVSGRFRRARP